MHSISLRWLALFFVMAVFTGCVSVKPYQRYYLNDEEMQLGHDALSGFDEYFESIREGSTTAGGVKTSNGCGCN